jgi:HEAT repeat protein
MASAGPRDQGLERKAFQSSSETGMVFTLENAEQDHDEAAQTLGKQIGADIRKGLEERYGIHDRCSEKWVAMIGEDGDDAESAADIIVEDRCVSLADAVAALTNHSHSKVRRIAAEILGTIGKEGSLLSLTTLMKDEDDTVQAASLRAFCKLARSECRPKLREQALEASSWRVRKAAVEIAGEVGHEFALTDVVRLLADPVPDVGESALRQLPCEYLANSDLRSRVLGLAGEVEKEASDRRYAAIQALDKCRIKEAGKLLTTMLANRERYHIGDDETWLLIKAIGACDGRGGAAAIAKFASSHSSSEDLWPISASNIYTALEAAFDVLSEIGGNESAEALAKGLNDPFYRVRLAAVRAAKKLGLVCDLRSSLLLMSKSDPSREVATAAAEALSENVESCHKDHQKTRTVPH